MKSCGKSGVLNYAYKHGMFGTRIHKIWDGMIQRCHNKKSKDYENWGKRGIIVCLSWRRFENFYKDMGDPPEGHSLDRIDNDGPYAKWNCRWATHKQQHRNKRNNRIIIYRGKEACVSEWAETLGVKKSSLEWRLRNGWSVAASFEKPYK